MTTKYIRRSNLDDTMAFIVEKLSCEVVESPSPTGFGAWYYLHKVNC